MFAVERLLHQHTEVLWPRALALFIDTVFITICGTPSIYIYHVINIGMHSAIPLIAGMTLSLSTIGIVAYFTTCEALFGATLGKQCMHLRVVAIDGTPIHLWQALTRNVIRPFEYAILFFSALITGFSPRHQRLGDFAARTIVVSEESLVTPATATAGSKRKTIIVVVVALSYYALLIKSGLR